MILLFLLFEPEAWMIDKEFEDMRKFLVWEK